MAMQDESSDAEQQLSRLKELWRNAQYEDFIRMQGIAAVDWIDQLAGPSENHIEEALLNRAVVHMETPDGKGWTGISTTLN